MGGYGEILIYMGHKGEVDSRLEALICSSLEKLEAVCKPLHIMALFPCKVTENRIIIDSLIIESEGLSAHLCNCTQVYVFAATLGSAVDRLIAQRAKIDSAEALCVQACAAARIENYCDNIEQELTREAEQSGLYLRPRFSPGYGDFSIVHQTDILNILGAHKRIGVTETKTHMLTPLKSVTAVIGVSAEKTECASQKCAGCSKTDCSFKERGVNQ